MFAAVLDPVRGGALTLAPREPFEAERRYLEDTNVRGRRVTRLGRGYPPAPMSFLLFLLLVILQGAIVGGLARLALPGPDPMPIGKTIGIGVAGSFIAGVLAYLLFGTGAGFLRRSSSPSASSTWCAAHGVVR